MDNTLEIRTISLALAWQRNAVEMFLHSAGLSLDSALSYITCIYTADDELVGCAGLDGCVIKCVAMSESMRGQGIAATLISEMLRQAFEAGITTVMLFTKPEYESLFAQLGFSLCGRSDKAVLLLSDETALNHYKAALSAESCDAVIVMNANPCTKGHLHLINYAAEHSRRVAIIPLAEHESNMFTLSEREEMIRNAVSHLTNVVVMPSSPYTISAATFPSYFLKEVSDIADAQAELDLDIFARHIAPSLGVRRRYVGEEPQDKLTARYNELMHRILPVRGIEVVEIPRAVDDDGTFVSATDVRKALLSGSLIDALRHVPHTSLPYIITPLAIRALRMELELTPKPGLVDIKDSGSHTDMDYSIMMKGILALRSYFIALTKESMSPILDVSRLRELGIRAEQQMLSATKGINTHKGAIFAIGLAAIAAGRIISGCTENNLAKEIALVACAINRNIAENCKQAKAVTHGDLVRMRSGLPGAMDYAMNGYNRLFVSWLPYMRDNREDEYVLHKLLLKIISEIEDSNACYRAGEERAALAKVQALNLYNDFSIAGMEKLNTDYKSCNISHGGAADMLSLTIFVDSVLSACESAHKIDE